MAVASGDEKATPMGEPLAVDRTPPCNNIDKQGGKDADEEQKKKRDKGSLRAYLRIFRYADTLDRILYAIAIVGAIIVGAAMPLMTLIFGSSTTSFNNYAEGHSNDSEFQSNISNLVLWFVYLFIGRFVVSYVSTLCVCIAAARTTNALRKAFLESLLRQGIPHFDRQDNGSAATQVTTNGYRINQGIAEKLYTFFVGVSLLLSAYIVALIKQWKLALIIMSIFPALVLVIGICIAFDAPIENRITRIYSRAATLAQDTLASVKTIYAFGAQSKIVAWYDEYLQSAHHEGKKKSLIYGVLWSAQTFLVMSGNALAFWEGYRLFHSGEIDNVGTVFTVVLAVTLGATSILFVLPHVQAITNASSAAAELFSIIDKPSELDPLAPDGQRPDSCKGNLEFRNVEFAYPARPGAPVLQNLSFSIPFGKTTALVGPSGCGKSTMVGLLERWYRPSSGQILLDGTDISELNTKWLRSHIRLVQQEPSLFSGSIFQNVANGLVGDQHNLTHDSKMKLVREACIAADAHDFIEKLPQGYYTQLAENAAGLSGGQRQRISIARTIVSDPKILLFDEATSALDPRAEKAVQKALDRVSQNKTTLVIAHKLATVMNADKIVVINSGTVVEQGTHRELIEFDGLYAALVRAQDLGADAREQEFTHESTNDGLYPSKEKDMDHDLQQHSSLLRNQSEDHLTSSAQSHDPLAAETLNYSLIKCVSIMLREQPDLYIYYALIVLAGLILGGSYPAQAIIFSRFIGVFRSQDAQSQADFWALMFFVLALANLLGYFTTGVACNTIAQALTHRYRREMIERMLSFDQTFFDRVDNSSGALTAKLSSVPAGIQELMSANLGSIVNVIVNITSSSILAITFGWKLGLTIVFAGLTVIVGSGYIRIRMDQRLEAATERQFVSSAGLATEAVSSIRTVSLLTLEESVIREYSMTLDSIVAKVIRSLIPTLVAYAFSQSAEFLVMALGFWYGAQLFGSGEYSIDQFFVIFVAVIFGSQGAAQFFQYTTSITKAKGGANYLLWLRTIPATIRETEDNGDRGPAAQNSPLDLEHVGFRYGKYGSPKVLDGISMNIAPGTLAAFVGASGCGKSTLIALIERFYDPTSGRITLNGEDIKSFSPRLYRQHISLVQQEPPLYLGSVLDNIALGLDREPTDEEVQEACRQANAWDFVSSLPEGLNTPCGSKGLQFSGGQRQRIAVARALIRRPYLLLLDEATSALDTQSEQIMLAALDKAASVQGRTTIAVAHRLSTIRKADVIYVLEGGRIVEQGTHQELQDLRGRYYSMCLAQSLDQTL